MPGRGVVSNAGSLILFPLRKFLTAIGRGAFFEGHSCVLDFNSQLELSI
jgi:hypothetical protein